MKSLRELAMAKIVTPPSTRGSMPYVYIKPRFFPEEIRQRIENGEFTHESLYNHVHAYRVPINGAIQEDVAFLGDESLKGCPIGGVGKEVFTVSITDFCPGTNQATMRVDSQVDMAFWLHVTIPIETLNRALQALPSKMPWPLPVAGRVSSYLNYSCQHWSHVHVKFNPLQGQGLTASLCMMDDQSFEIQVRAAHSPNFGLSARYKVSHFEVLCSYIHPDSGPFE